MRVQTKLEERLNAWTHGIGAALGIAALVLLVVYSDSSKPWSLFSVIIYGISIIILFLASTFYHAVEGEKQKHNFRIVDHISIYLLIEFARGCFYRLLMYGLSNCINDAQANIVSMV